MASWRPVAPGTDRLPGGRNAALDEQRPAVRGHARELAVRLALLEARVRLLRRGLGLFDRRFRLVNLLIQLRRVDFRQHLADPHAVPDVGETTFEVAVGARQDRRLGQRLHRPGQLEHVLVRAAADAHHRQARQALLLSLRLRSKRGLAPLQRQIAGQERDHQQHEKTAQQRRDGRGRRTPDGGGRNRIRFVVSHLINYRVWRLKST